MSDADSTIPAGFRQIKDFPRYAIDENGTVLSINTTSKMLRPWSKATPIATPVNNRGYKIVVLHNGNGIHKTVYVHSLVLLAFVGPRPDGMECRHLDGNCLNNHISNLIWGTHVNNEHDKFSHGTSSKGGRNGSAKLTDNDVLQIRQRAETGEIYQTIADDFGISVSNVCMIVRKHTWTHI